MPGTAARNKKRKQLKGKDANLQKENTFLQWKYDTTPRRTVAELQQCSEDELETHLKQILGLQNVDICMREAALLDFYITAFWWTKEMNFSPTQTSFTMALLHQLLENLRGKQMSLVENLVEFAKALAPACQNLTEDDSSPLLYMEEAKELTTYFKNCFFQKYSLFKFLFTTPREELLSSVEKTVEVFTYSDTPLEESIPANLYFE